MSYRCSCFPEENVLLNIIVIFSDLFPYNHNILKLKYVHHIFSLFLRCVFHVNSYKNEVCIILLLYYCYSSFLYWFSFIPHYHSHHYIIYMTSSIIIITLTICTVLILNFFPHKKLIITCKITIISNKHCSLEILLALMIINLFFNNLNCRLCVCFGTQCLSIFGKLA